MKDSSIDGLNCAVRSTVTKILINKYALLHFPILFPILSQELNDYGLVPLVIIIQEARKLTTHLCGRVNCNYGKSRVVQGVNK